MIATDNGVDFLRRLIPTEPQPPRRKVSKPQTWALITFGAMDDGMCQRLDPDLPAFVSIDTRGNVWGGRTYLTHSLKAARKFRTRQACHRFLQRLDCHGVRPINLTRFGVDESSTRKETR